MNLISKRIRGMQDILPGESEKWEYIEKILKEKAKLFGFKVVRTPVLEYTNLFERSSGETSDVVEKEMYTFLDKGGRSVTLRPEGTAGVLRAVLENGLHGGALPLKLMYVSSCYRYEKPQSGRLREFFQFGLETFGGKSALADAEIICIANSIFDDLGIKNLELEINAVGCQKCKKNYNEAVRKYFLNYEKDLCETCTNRLARNPLRIFDCKSQNCKSVAENAPKTTDYLCQECKLHFEELEEYLEAFNIKYKLNTRIVRGLDYYNKTVFEFVIKDGGEPLTLCGGGRYDDLSKSLGGNELSSVGLGIGFERLLMVMQNQHLGFEIGKSISVYVISLEEKYEKESLSISQRLRKIGIVVQQDISKRGLKSQLKYAGKAGFDYCLFLGSREMEKNTVKIKNMTNSEEYEVGLGEDFEKYFLDLKKNGNEEI